MIGYNNASDDPRMMADEESPAIPRPPLRVAPGPVDDAGSAAAANLILRALQGAGGAGAGWGGLGGLLQQALLGQQATFQHSPPSFMLNRGGAAGPRGENSPVAMPYRR
jgi:hypothetical protein